MPASRLACKPRPLHPAVQTQPQLLPAVIHSAPAHLAAGFGKRPSDGGADSAAGARHDADARLHCTAVGRRPALQVAAWHTLRKAVRSSRAGAAASRVQSSRRERHLSAILDHHLLPPPLTLQRGCHRLLLRCCHVHGLPIGVYHHPAVAAQGCWSSSGLPQRTRGARGGARPCRQPGCSGSRSEVGQARGRAAELGLEPGGATHLQGAAAGPTASCSGRDPTSELSRAKCSKAVAARP